jgi:hypothetical protein
MASAETSNQTISELYSRGGSFLLSKNWDINEVKALFSLFNLTINNNVSSARIILEQDSTTNSPQAPHEPLSITFTANGPIPKIAEVRLALHEILHRHAQNVQTIKRSVDEMIEVNIALDNTARKIKYPKGPHEATAQEFEELVVLYAEMQRLFECAKFAQGDIRAAKLVNMKRRQKCEEWLRVLDAAEETKKAG